MQRGELTALLGVASSVLRRVPLLGVPPILLLGVSTILLVSIAILLLTVPRFPVPWPPVHCWG